MKNKFTMTVRGIRRARRTDDAIKRALFGALSKIVRREGFMNITLKGICKSSQVNHNSIYTHYGSFEGLLEEYAAHHDYWIEDVGKIVPGLSADPKEYYCSVAEFLINALYDSKEYQAILTWEVAEDNKITRQMAARREAVSQALMQHIGSTFAESGIDFAIISAVIVGGINYLLLRRERSPFFGVDFAGEDGRQRLIKAVCTMIYALFSAIENPLIMINGERVKW